MRLSCLTRPQWEARYMQQHLGFGAQWAIFGQMDIIRLFLQHKHRQTEAQMPPGMLSAKNRTTIYA